MDFGAHFLGSVANETGLRGRSGFNGEDCLSRNLKLSRAEQEQAQQEEATAAAAASSSSFGVGGGGYNKTMSFHQGIPLMRSTPLLPSDSRRQEHMLSFSDKPEAPPPSLDFTKYVGLEQHKNSLSLLPPPSSYLRSSGGYGTGGMMMNMNMQGRGPFTMTQWAELEQQALIYKYIAANVPVPPSLLHSIKKSFYPYGSLPPSSFGWGGFHLGFAGSNMDPEPGRCRRTDGKKWRCSRDAVPDQKYCERHINRGRHRSRKPVEVQSDQTSAAASVGASKAVLTPQQSVVAGGSNRRNARVSSSNGGLTIGNQYINPPTDTLLNNRVRTPVYPSMVDLQPKETALVQQKQSNDNDDNPFEFGHISSDSLLNPNTAKSYGSSYLDFSNNQDKHTSNHNLNSWSEELNPDWTQLSMSIPIASASSSSPSLTQDKIATLSPLRLSREFDLSFQTEKETLEPTVKKVNTWIPISWGNSLGGPLGEVLNSTTNSPTGVLQKTTFCTLSNSSSVSSPNADNNNNNNNRNKTGEYFHYTT